MGMFDVVYFPCPACGQDAYIQSKAGPCSDSSFKYDDLGIPEAILLDVVGEYAYCYSCQNRFRVVRTLRDWPRIELEYDDD